jgi:hypothetical protein
VALLEGALVGATLADLVLRGNWLSEEECGTLLRRTQADGVFLRLHAMQLHSSRAPAMLPVASELGPSAAVALAVVAPTAAATEAVHVSEPVAPASAEEETVAAADPAAGPAAGDDDDEPAPAPTDPAAPPNAPTPP